MSPLLPNETGSLRRVAEQRATTPSDDQPKRHLAGPAASGA